MVYHLEVDGSTKINGTLVTTNLSTSGTKNFKIPHPILENKSLIHSCIECPRIENLYRGKKELINGKCQINIDTDCNENGGMSEGTFEKIFKYSSIIIYIYLLIFY